MTKSINEWMMSETVYVLRTGTHTSIDTILIIFLVPSMTCNAMCQFWVLNF